MFLSAPQKKLKPNWHPCPRCGISFPSHQGLGGHMGKNKECANTLQFTQAQIQKEVRDGVVKVMNNGQVGQAYKNQLYNQPSLSAVAAAARQQFNDNNLSASSSSESNTPFDNAIDFYPDDNSHQSSIQSDDDNSSQHDDDDDLGLPKKYTDAAERYKEIRDALQLQDAFQQQVS